MSLGKLKIPRITGQGAYLTQDLIAKGFEVNGVARSLGPVKGYKYNRDITFVHPVNLLFSTPGAQVTRRFLGRIRLFLCIRSLAKITFRRTTKAFHCASSSHCMSDKTGVEGMVKGLDPTALFRSSY